jgi:hypothetical protein
MKTLLSRGKGLAARAARLSGGHEAEAEEEEEEAAAGQGRHGLDLSQVTLMSTGRYHTDVLMAKVGHDLVGGMGMEEDIEVSWFRKPAKPAAIAAIAAIAGGAPAAAPTAATEFVRIDGVQSAYYTPSADDIGATVCFRCQDKRDPTNQGFAQIGPLDMEPSVREGVAEARAAKGGAFPVTIASRPGQTLQLVFDDSAARVVLEAEKEGAEVQGGGGSGVAAVDGDVMFAGTFADGVSVIIEASSSLALELVAFCLEPGDVTTACVTSRLLVSATSPRDRDIIAMGIRALRDTCRSSLLLPSVSSITLREPVGEFGFDDNEKGDNEDEADPDRPDAITAADDDDDATAAASTAAVSDENNVRKNDGRTLSKQGAALTSSSAPASASSAPLNASASAAAAVVRSLRAKVTFLEAKIARTDEREATLEASVTSSQHARKSMETELVAMQAERDTANASAASATGELVEARELAKAAGAKQRKAELQVKTLEEENGVLQAEIKRAKRGHAEARKARQV